jgi:hypothetical protein
MARDPPERRLAKSRSDRQRKVACFLIETVRQVGAWCAIALEQSPWRSQLEQVRDSTIWPGREIRAQLGKRK